ncbi:MAG: GAF domain-containing protein [Trichocoleus desertorum ATA4-8-CV12]|jgi:DNA-binding CsgD family transcriptional regulator|nr:GAF domain-containing protein [Trichocoleus desertorum ATA4-8-CV12]
MPDSPIELTERLDSTRILFDLQQGNEIAQGFSGCLEPEEIARRVTTGLVEKFDCALARIWLLEAQATLKLVASSGMYTHLNGTFARVPMGAYKVGKIAQNRVSFLSNHLAAEPWVGNREWAIANNIRGFAGYPLVMQDRVIGVLAAFSHQAMEAEFLEVLQTLCTVTAIALDTASQYQQEKQMWQSSAQALTQALTQAAVPSPAFNHLSLSDQLVSLLSSTRLTLVGTERPLTLPVAYVFLQTAEILHQFTCNYCRLIYTAESVALEAMIPTTHLSQLDPKSGLPSLLNELFFTVSCLGGVLQTQTTSNQRAMQFLLKVPYWGDRGGQQLRIQCRLPVLQLAFTHLAFWAGLQVCREVDQNVPLLTDDATQIQTAKWLLWVQQGTQTVPQDIQGRVNLSTSPEQLKQAVEAVLQGDFWGVDLNREKQPTLSERELEILTLLTQGHRDRDIADRLIISESTVKFHMNNVLTKLKARTRYQAIHQAIVKGWMQI